MWPLHMHDRARRGLFPCSCAAQTNTFTRCQFSSTSLPCSWLPPTFQSVKFDEICKIDFTTPQHKRKSSDNDHNGKKPRLEIPKTTEEDLRNHRLCLSRMKGKPNLSFVSGHMCQNTLVVHCLPSFMTNFLITVIPRPPNQVQ